MTAASTNAIPRPPANVQKKSRVEAVDALRGLALAGMLLVHFQYYVHDDSVWSQRIGAAVDFLAVDRFYPLFALLFGAGFALQFARWEGHREFVTMYVRRLSALMVFAAILIALTGYHVLESYALWGLALLVMRRWSNRMLIIVVLLSAFSRPVAHFICWEWERWHNITLEQSNARVDQDLRQWPDYQREEDRLRDQGSFRQLATHRLKHNFGALLHWQSDLPSDPFLMMLLGLLAVRLRVFEEIARHSMLLISIIVYGAVAGIISTLIWNLWHPQFTSLRLGMVYRTLVFAILDERFQGLGYAAALLLWTVRRGASQRLLSFLASPGRLSLTNYVMQVAILEILFASSTPLLRLNRWSALTGVLLLFVFQVWFSRMWMARYRYGPLEWLWRSITMLSWQPLLHERAQAAGA
jgi:uncharacterized protein